jgi:hypothetical protein
VTTRLFPPEDLLDLLDDVIDEITEERALLPAEPRVRSFARVQRQPGRRFPRQKEEYKQPLPPRVKIIFWVIISDDP